MPGFDGTGPRGEGPLTGRGEGHCALVLPGPGDQDVVYGYAGQQGIPVQMEMPQSPSRRQSIGGTMPGVRLGCAFRRRRRLLGRGFWGRGWRW
ncbi:MAG: DUF5320 domain-containing protein [Anaerolineae bacterium]|nr:DUF5320 domain-containing protein [Anaerolineae bacterium]